MEREGEDGGQENMLNLKEFLDTPIGRGVKDLSEQLRERGMPPVTLNCIGGFALMMHNMRDPQAFTDIDYVGKHLGQDFDQLVNEIGARHGLGKGWINNDGMFTGMTVKDFELSTGELHFDHALDVGGVTINVLQQPDLLRTKLISIDTSLMAAQDKSDDFARSRDMSDIQALMEKQGLDLDGVKETYGDYLKSDQTIPAVQAFAEGGLPKVYEVLAANQKDITEVPKEIDREAEKQTDIGKAIASGGFSIGSILDMAKAGASRRSTLPFDFGSGDGPGGEDGPTSPWE